MAVILALSVLGNPLQAGRAGPALSGLLPGVRSRSAPAGGGDRRRAVIDGRIVDIGRTGFILGTLVVPRFVLDELQRIADSPDARRNRGRRGLEMLALRRSSVNPVEVSEASYPEIDEVDAKLVAYARDTGAVNDQRLQPEPRGGHQGIRVLNINELANGEGGRPSGRGDAGQDHPGGRPGQGVGYLDDGTMIVVEGGSRFMDSSASPSPGCSDGGRPHDLRAAPRVA